MLLAWAMVGLVVGTGLDLVIRALISARADRIAGCAGCRRARVDWGLVPLLGQLVRKRCETCGRRTWPSSMAIQLATSAAFGALAWRLPLDWPLLVFSVDTALLLIVFVTDLRHRLILNVVTYPGMLFALGAGATLFGPDSVSGLARSALGGAFGGGLFLALYLLATVIYRRGDAFGLGDVKLALMIGLMTGWPGAETAILLGTFCGAILGLMLMARHRNGKATMPYGTALALGAFASILWHPPA